MASVLKPLLEGYKEVNKDFRHEFDGETWKVWIAKDNGTSGYPDYQGMSADVMHALMVRLIREEVNALEGSARSKLATASRLKKLLDSR